MTTFSSSGSRAGRSGTRTSPLIVGSCSSSNSSEATTTQSTRAAGMTTCRGWSEPAAAVRVTSAMTMPPEFRAAIAR